MPNAPTRELVPGEACLLHSFLERSVREHPARLALDIPGNGQRPRRSLTYAELDARAESLARRIAGCVEGECVVAILLPRHAPELFVAQLGILRAGAAYTCLDSSFPDAHAAFLLEDSRAVALVTDAEGARRAREARFPVARIVELDLEREETHAAPAAKLPAWLRPSSLAYVIYTSGTTGKPKGVLIEHASIANLVASDLERFRLGTGDRVAQGSSPAYDSAVEETWLAFASGATLVVLDDEVVRRGPDLVPWLREERVSVFCPPPTLLRAMGCRDPERELPELRLLYVGGEALPRDVADRWAPGRWLENGYGPTECSVTVVRARIEAGAPITIGLPVSGNQAWILDEDLRPVADGTAGELCIWGAGLARGYLNRPELTAEKFPVLPGLGRIYRTGDLVRRLPDGQLECLGRIDAQVKLRGHRIELGAIESVLAAQPGVHEAACALQTSARGPVLVAFVVPRPGSEAPSFEQLERVLRETFPAYMVPSRFGRLDALPRSVGGKLDRAALPALSSANPERATPAEAARDALEARIAAVFQQALDLHEPPGIAADFFVDLGGDSLAAAVAISLLRDDPLTAELTVRDLYAARTLAALAQRARKAHGGAAQEPARRPSAPRLDPVSNARLVFTSAMQALFIACELFVGATLVWLAGFELLPRAALALGLPATLLLAPLAALLAWIASIPATVLLLVAAKKLLIGTYRPERVPVLSGTYLRNWIVQQIAHLVPWNLIAGTEFENAALRALGARIGKRVHIHRGVILCEGGWDLLTIGDDVMVGQDATLRLVDLVGGCLVIGPVTLGKQSTLDVRAGMSAHSELGERAYLGALSNLPAGGRVPEGECWDGVPAAPAGPAPERPAHVSKRELSPLAHAALLLFGRGVSSLVFGLPLFVLLSGALWLSGSDPRALGAALLEGSWSGFGLVPLTAVLVLSLPLGLALEALWLRLLGRVELGSISRFDPAYARIALKAEVLQSAGDWLAGTLLWPVWLRMAGMRVGRNCEISTIVDVVPESLEIGDDCFLADGIYLGGPRLHRGVVTVTRTRLASRDFLGNHAVILSGQELPEEVLVGVCTVPDTHHMHGGSSWFGHPPFELPRHKHTGFDRSLTHKPNLWRLANRLFWELARFLLPVPPLWLFFATTSWAAARLQGAQGPLESIGIVAVAALVTSAVLVLAVLALKWILLGRVKPGEHALWSFWCCRWDYHYELWSAWARHVLACFEGTLYLPWYLRAMGARIGRRTVLAGGFAHVVDPDMLHIEDGVTVHALFQAHSFEDRVLKIDRITIRRGADVGSGAVLFYGAEIGEGAVVAPHSVVMKHERLLPGRVYEGCPTVLCQGHASSIEFEAREPLRSAVPA